MISSTVLLTEFGTTDSETALITGCKSKNLIVKYADGAKQKRLAKFVVKL